MCRKAVRGTERWKRFRQQERPARIPLSLCFSLLLSASLCFSLLLASLSLSLLYGRYDGRTQHLHAHVHIYSHAVLHLQ